TGDDRAQPARVRASTGALEERRLRRAGKNRSLPLGNLGGYARRGRIAAHLRLREHFGGEALDPRAGLLPRAFGEAGLAASLVEKSLAIEAGLDRDLRKQKAAARPARDHRAGLRGPD